MKRHKEYNIDIFRLDNKEHAYDYEVGNAFYSEFEDSYAENANLNVHLVLDKKETLIELHFDIKGSVRLICDRSLDEYDQDVDIRERLILKYGEEDEEVSDEISIIRHDKQRINVAQYIYELIGISLPMKKLHPRYLADDTEDEDEDVTLIYTSAESQEREDNEEEEQIDSRWLALKKLKGKENDN